MTYCTVEYNGRGQPDHLRAGFNLRERVFASGQRVEVDAETAGLLVKSAPKDSVTVHDGTPGDGATRNHRADLQSIRRDRLRETFPQDPARLLSAVTPLPKAIREGLTGKDAEAFLAAGKADACLFDAATWAQLGGLDAVAKAAIRRAATLTAKG